MPSNHGSGSGMGSDADVAALAALVAEAGALAEQQSAGASERVKAREMALRGIAAELAGVFAATDRTLQRRIDEARDLVDNYPLTMAAWEAGRIVRGHVRVIQDV